MLFPFRGVVVDHVEDHLDARGVQGPHHLLELAHACPRHLARGVALLGGEEPQRVVAEESQLGRRSRRWRASVCIVRRPASVLIDSPTVSITMNVNRYCVSVTANVSAGGTKKKSEGP